MTVPDETSPLSHRTLLQAAGACGILAPIIALSCISLAILYSPGNFSITQNWLSDLGGMSYAQISRPSVTSPTTIMLFQSGLVLAGILGIIFSLGLFVDNRAPLFRLGAVCALLGAAALAGVGLFSEPLGIIHTVVSFAFGILITAAMFLVGGSLVGSSSKRLGVFSIILGVPALVGISQFSSARGVAEVVLATAAGLWLAAFGIRMLKRALLLKR